MEIVFLNGQNIMRYGLKSRSCMPRAGRSDTYAKERTRPSRKKRLTDVLTS